MINRKITLILAVLSLLFGLNYASADERSYVWTYEYMTLPAGEAELEYYFTISAPDRSNLKTNVTTEHKFEYEVGMTKRFDFAIYQVFEQESDESLKYKAFQLRGRYRFGEQGSNLMDSLLYLEYEGVPDFSEHVIEAKWVLSKTIGRFNISLNPILELEIGDETELETEYAIGAGYAVNNLLKIGIEAKGGEYAHYIGPVIAHGSGRFWSTLGTAFRIDGGKEDQPEFQARLLLGAHL